MAAGLRASAKALGYPPEPNAGRASPRPYWYLRAANPQARREALTSRPLLLAAVGRATNSGNQTTLHLTPMHAEVGLIKSMIANVRAAIGHIKEAAEQLPKIDRWATLLAYICQRIVGNNPCRPRPQRLNGRGNCGFRLIWA